MQALTFRGGCISLAQLSLSLGWFDHERRTQSGTVRLDVINALGILLRLTFDTFRR